MSWKGADCKNCPFAKNGKPQHPPVPAEQPYHWPPKGVLVGESPGAEEVNSGRPFSGATGQQLDQELESVGLFRGQLLVINAIACRPTSKKQLDMRKAATCCRPAFLKQVKAVPRATPAFAMGKWAIYQATGKFKSVSKLNGFLQEEWTWKVGRRWHRKLKVKKQRTKTKSNKPA